MKTLALLLTTILITTTTYAQVAVLVTSNPCNPVSEHPYNFTMADWLNSPNQSFVQAELVLVNDGTTLGVFTNIGTPPISAETTTDACEDTVWTQDLTGKIAVIWRGGCEFSCKAEKAQSKGAIGVIIINHTGAATGMSGGTCGNNVTIPVAMIDRQDGEDLMSCIAGGGVFAFIGNTNGAFANDLGSSMSEILMTESLAIPWDLARNGTEYPVDFGLWIRNKGTNPQNGITTSVNVAYNGSIIYSQTSVPVNFNVSDTQYIHLGTYAPTLWNVGTYTATYVINGANDEYLPDNTFSFEFKFTNNEDVYAKCKLDSLNQPIHNTAYSVNTTGCYDNLESCIVFKNNLAGTRNAVAIGMTLSSQGSTGPITNQPIEIRTYQWNDGFLNINSPATFNNISLLDSSNYIYTDSMLNNVNIYLPFNLPIVLQDNQRYLFCVRNMSPQNYLTGYYTQNDYTATVKHYLQPISTVSTTDCLDNTIWYNDGFGLDAVPAISVTMDIATNLNETTTEATSYPYPNPTTNCLTMPLKQHGVGSVKLEVFDILGKLVLTETQTLRNEPLKINVAPIVNGNYLFKLTFADGSSDVFKVSVNR